MRQQSYVLVFISILLISGVVNKSDAAPNKSISADSLKKQIRKHYKSSPMLALDYANELQKISKESNNKVQESNALWAIGNINKKLGNYNKSVEAYFKVLPIYKDQENTKYLAMAYFNIAKILTGTKNDVGAVAYFKNALSLYTQLNNENGIAKTNVQLGKSYVNLKDYQKARVHLQIGLRIGNNKTLPIIYNWLGRLETDIGNYEKAIGYYDTSLKFSEKENDLSEKAAALLNLGVVYFKINNIKVAKEFANKSITLAKKTNDINKQTKPQILLAEIAAKQKGNNIEQVKELLAVVRDFDATNYNAYLQEALYYLSEEAQQNILANEELKEMMRVLSTQGKISSALYEKTKTLLNQHSLQLSIDKVKAEQRVEILEEKNDFKQWAIVIVIMGFLGIITIVLMRNKYKKRLREYEFAIQHTKEKNENRDIVNEIRSVKNLNNDIDEELYDHVVKNAMLIEKTKKLEAEIEAYGDEFLVLTNRLSDSKNTMFEMSKYVWNMIKEVSRQGFKIPPPPPWDLGDERDN